MCWQGKGCQSALGIQMDLEILDKQEKQIDTKHS